MKILLDHCVPRPFKSELNADEVHTAREKGWEALKNGELLRQAVTNGFQALITVDQNLRYQLNLQQSPIAVCVLIAPGATIADLRPLAPKLREVLAHLEPGKLYEIRF